MPTKYRLSYGCVLTPLEDEALLVPLSSGAADMNAYITLNSTAAVLAQAFKQGATIEEAADTLAARYDKPDRERILDDARQLVKQLSDMHLLDVVNP